MSVWEAQLWTREKGIKLSQFDGFWRDFWQHGRTTGHVGREEETPAVPTGRRYCSRSPCVEPVGCRRRFRLLASLGVF